MKINLIISLFIFMLSISSCNNGRDTPKQDNAEKLVREEAIEEELFKEPSYEDASDERSNWQKPNLVIAQFGNIDGKVVADIGAGALGYFVFKMLRKSDPKSVIAIDIDSEAVDMLERFKNALPDNKKDKLEVRLALPNDSKLKDAEADAILIVNTIGFIESPENYLKHLHNKLSDQGKIVIVDYKTKRIPEFADAPPYQYRAYLHEVEEYLYKAGYSEIITDDTSLEYQYIIRAKK